MNRSNSFYCRFIKRFIDIVISLLILILFFGVYGIVALLIRVKLGSPVFYKAERAGKIDKRTGKESSFFLYKFRSMSNAKDQNGNLLPDVERLTPFGRKIRALSIDEIPEVYNILKGDMSFIGPRPLPVSYVPYYTEKEHHRHDLRPGLSGLAQVNGRNAISWDKKFSYDLEYVNNVSFLGDLKIVFMTIKKVLIREGIGQGEEHPGSLYDVRKRDGNSDVSKEKND